MSCSGLCCPSDKHFLISECISPKNTVFRQDVPSVFVFTAIPDARRASSDCESAGIKPKIPLCNGLTSLSSIIIYKDPVDPKENGSAGLSNNESPGLKGRSSLRKISNASSPTKSGFLARARAKTRNSSQISVGNTNEYYIKKPRSLTNADEEIESISVYQTRISIDSPNQNAGDFEEIEFY